MEVWPGGIRSGQPEDALHEVDDPHGFFQEELKGSLDVSVRATICR